jgi:O-succinylbenzoic acid--CoA ligase
MISTLTAVRAAADGSADLLPRLAAALDGTGPAVLPVPDDPAIRERLLRTMRPDDPAAPLEVADLAAVVATSGSSGEPKGVLLTRAAMTAAGERLHRLVGGPGTWLLALPSWHVGGLQVLTRSVLAGTVPVALDLRAGFRAEAFVEGTHRLAERAAGGRTYASLVPTQVERILAAGPEAVQALVGYDAVLVGSAATSPDLANRARAAGVRLLVSYGMSETSGGCCYDGHPLEDVRVRIRDEDDRVLVTGPTVFSGYRLRPDLTAETLRDGWVVTPDVGRLTDEGRLEVLGRADDMVVTGGEKVSPLAVADALRSHPDVLDAAVVGVPDAEWGQAVVAYVVPGAGAAPGVEGLRDHVRDLLGRAAAPRRVVVVEQLPMLESGKVDRAELVRRAG